MSDHYFSEHPRSQFKLIKIRIYARGISINLFSAPGIFSFKKLDFGTKVLIDNMIIKDKKKVLDLGTGYGVVGITYAILSPSSKVYMTDINERAIEIAKMNVNKLNLKNCVVLKSNLFESIKGHRFDIIITNPPLTAGLKVCYTIIEESYHHLNDNGVFQFVARHKKGGRRLMEKTINIFDNCSILAKSGGYWVYLAKKNIKKDIIST